ncbi:methylated-DNA--[protein]-cysteine S-methyltransferase [Allorhizocola rhizosphaerae]|uniref:methylated-DNA--[protein]-cysteine S-methyltransferase n=1 Tax=Allorhizocola rhizosphaerae TaxID=1872709 RepID=UPI001FE8B03F|nr:methylated-DNA--[protein]-cysteine S-methyltransferase [Allorhizocola rhizosphaerae]
MITIETPIGPFSMTGNGFAVTQARFGNPDLPDGEVPEQAVKALHAYFDGDFHALDSVPVQQSGTPYLEHCWDVLRTLTEPITYTEFAHITGKPHAVRAAAQGCARNLIALFVPCHRVLRTDGTLGGYRWGLDIKRALLEHERLIVAGTR